jgi:hypothetical protein
LETARKTGVAAGLGVDLTGIADALKEINELLERTGKNLSLTGRSGH